MYVIFQTPRLILRQITLEDARLILQLNSNPEVVKYLHEPTLQSLADAESVISNIILPQYKNNLGRWAIINKTDNNFMGWCGLKYRPELEEIDLGYRLMQACWDKGYATEAAEHTLNHGFNTLNLPLITGRAHIENRASIKVLEKIGMQFISEGIVDDSPIKTYTKLNPSA